MDEASIKAVVEPVLKSRLQDFGYEDSSVRSGEDHDGDPVLFVDAHFDPGSRILGGELILSIIGEVRSRLIERGETRYPHIRWYYATGEYPDDESLFADATSDL